MHNGKWTCGTGNSGDSYFFPLDSKQQLSEAEEDGKKRMHHEWGTHK